MLVSVTMTNRRDDLVVAALRSVVDHVDRCLVVSTHETHDYDFAVEREVCGDKLITGMVAPIYTPEDTARARNECLAMAGAHGATWALILDTDERMHWREGDEPIRDMLARSQLDSYVLRAQEGHYSKDKLIRPGTGEFQAKAHEAWVPNRQEGRALLHPGPRFSELPKSKEATAARDRAVVEVLLREIEQHPTDGRAHFYLAQSYDALGDYEPALKHYELCVRNTHWGEEAGWSNYRSGVILFMQGKANEAVASCALALGCNPACAEAAWLAGVIRSQQGRAQDAIAWSSMAVANGMHAGIQGEMWRLHIRDPRALWEAPYETLRACYQAMGQPDRARICAELWHDAYKRRLAEDGGAEVLPEQIPPLDGVYPPVQEAAQ